MNEPLTVESGLIESPTMVATEEFFERALFQDILEMKSVQQVSDATAVNAQKIRDQVYTSLFELFQHCRGLNTESPQAAAEIFSVFELFLKNYYQHFRSAMETLIAEKSPVRVAYLLGKKSDRLNQMIDELIQEIQTELA